MTSSGKFFLMAFLVILAHTNPVADCFSISNYYQGQAIFNSLSQLNMVRDDIQKSPESGYEDKKKVRLVCNAS